MTLINPLLILVMVGFVLSPPLRGADSGKHLFILSGQSNMHALDPSQTFTPALAKEFGEANIIVVKNAVSGQPIRRWYKDWKPAKNWVPEKPEEKPPVATGDLNDVLMKEVNKAMQGQRIQSVTFIWMQGESDALQKHGEVYGESLKGLVAQLQKDLGRPDLNVVIGRLSDFGVGRNMPHWLMVRQAQVEFSESGPHRAWVDTDDLNDGKISNGQKIINDLHYSEEGYKLLGERFARKAINLITKSR